MPPCVLTALIDEAGTTATCEGVPPIVRLSAFVEDGATVNATPELPIVPLYVPDGSVSASWHVVPPETGVQPLDEGPTETVWLIVTGPFMLIASACDPGGGGAVAVGTGVCVGKAPATGGAPAVIGGGGVAIGADRLMFAADRLPAGT
jgi:hypothetical protein